jgi:hypothetical protein
MKDENRKRANTACSVHPIPCKERRGHGGGTRHVFEQFVWLEVGSVKVALSRPAWWLTGEAVSKPTSGYPAESMRGLRKPLGGSNDTLKIDVHSLDHRKVVLHAPAFAVNGLSSISGFYASPHCDLHPDFPMGDAENNQQYPEITRVY